MQITRSTPGINSSKKRMNSEMKWVWYSKHVQQSLGQITSGTTNPRNLSGMPGWPASELCSTHSLTHPQACATKNTLTPTITRGEEELGSKVTACQSLGNMVIKPEFWFLKKSKRKTAVDVKFLSGLCYWDGTSMVKKQKVVEVAHVELRWSFSVFPSSMVIHWFPVYLS